MDSTLAPVFVGPTAPLVNCRLRALFFTCRLPEKRRVKHVPVPDSVWSGRKQDSPRRTFPGLFMVSGHWLAWANHDLCGH